MSVKRAAIALCAIAVLAVWTVVDPGATVDGRTILAAVIALVAIWAPDHPSSARCTHVLPSVGAPGSKINTDSSRRVS